MKIIETMTPQTILQGRFSLRCQDCVRLRSYGSAVLDVLRDVAREHVRATNHTVDIMDETQSTRKEAAG